MTRNEVVRSLYLGILGRHPSGFEVEHWVAALEGGAPLSSVVQFFVDSPERQQVEHRQGARLAGRQPFYSKEELVEQAGGVTVVDVGAQGLANEDDVHQPLLDSGRATIVGFEPFEDEAQARRREGWVMLPFAVGDGATRTFYETVWSPTSSLYEPALDTMSNFEGLAEQCEVRATRPVETVRLDDALAGVLDGSVDFLKLDVQGAELDVLRGAERVLDRVLAVHTEVELHPIYRSQPLLEDVVGHLRTRGFDLFDLPRIERYRYRGGDTRVPGSRALWAEAVFVPATARLGRLTVAETLRLCWIMHDVYGAVDFAAWALVQLDDRSGTQFRAAYDELLTGL